jgi:lysophospholipase L1-like esterase
VAQLERYVRALGPRIITVYYGWNDHWVALGPTDRHLRRILRRRGFYERSRLAQLALKARIGTAPPRADRPNRVSEDDYRANLTRIVARASAAGIMPVLLTAPSNHTPGREPEVLLQRHVRRLAELVPLHTAYTAITRDVARATGAPLCDLAEAFDTLPPPRDRYFLQDGIHFTDEGDRAVSVLLAACLERLP